MNYKKIYNKIILSAKNRAVPNCYFEKHHIIPKSMGGKDCDKNIVKLTAREHFIAHWLLVKIHNNKQMTYAFFCMTKQAESKNQRYTSHSFKYARERMGAWLSENRSGENHPMFGLKGLDNPNTGSRRSEKTKKKISESAKKRYINRPSHSCKKVICVETGEVFNSVCAANKSTGGNVSYALTKGGTAGGFNFEYIDNENKNKLKGYSKGASHPMTKPLHDDKGNLFQSLVEAAKTVGVTSSAIGISIRQGRRCKGVLFSYDT